MKILGYASYFNNIDLAGDCIINSSFMNIDYKSVPILWQHNQREVIGHIDLAYQDAKGLLIQAVIYNDTKLSKYASDMIQKKYVSGFSIGYKVIKAFTDTETQIRYITELDLKEVSVVSSPANPKAKFYVV